MESRAVDWRPGESVAQLDDRSIAYLASRPKEERDPLGQFLTPRVLRDALLDQVTLSPHMRVLDPGVGTGEFLKSCQEREPNLSLTGWDIDAKALSVARHLVPHAQLEHRSALDAISSADLFSTDANEASQFDIVIGNPPYYEIRSMSRDDRRRFAEVISGRPNIFALFFKVGLQVVRPGGILAYVVPPSMNNGAYFDALRAYITRTANVEYLRVIANQHHFPGAQTSVQLIVLRKGEKESGTFTVDLRRLSNSPKSRIIFTERKSALVQSFAQRTSLWQLGYRVTTGTVVWNARKQDLRSCDGPGVVPLIWPHNIPHAETEIVLDATHRKRPQFIEDPRPQLGPAIVVNRITGSVGAGAIRCALIPAGMPYLAENHVNVVTPRAESSPFISLAALVEMLRQPHVGDAVRNLTGNTQLSATELMYWTPV